MKRRYCTYDGNGLRQSKTVNGVTTRHIYDGQNIVMDETGSETQHFFRGTELLLPTVNGKDMEYYLSDVHGDITKLMNTSGEIIRDYQYDGFGNQLHLMSTITPIGTLEHMVYEFCNAGADGKSLRKN